MKAETSVDEKIKSEICEKDYYNSEIVNDGKMLEQMVGKFEMAELPVKKEINEEIIIKDELEDSNLSEDVIPNDFEFCNIKTEKKEDEHSPSKDSNEIGAPSIPTHVMVTSSKKCEYKNCTSSKNLYPDLHFFKFPVRNSERCKVWLINSGNTSLLNMTEEKLSSKLLCEKHFSDESFTSSMKNRLLFYSVPNNFKSKKPGAYHVLPPEKTYSRSMHPPTAPSQCLELSPSDTNKSILELDNYKNQQLLNQPATFYKDSSKKVLTPKKSYSRNKQSLTLTPQSIELSSSDTNKSVPPTPKRIIDMDSPKKVKFSPRKLKLKEKIKMQSSLISQKRNMNHNLRSKLKLVESKIHADKKKQQKLYAETIVNILLKHKDRQPWTKTEQDMCLKIYFLSPILYKYMRKVFCSAFPSPATVRHWIKMRKGIKNKTMTDKLKLKASTTSNAGKHCSND